ncbi:MAG: VanZ family protein [Lachnospiraceae bacterium]|nr:VanZ family protein [Lachnospiraceae bacterium]
MENKNKINNIKTRIVVSWILVILWAGVIFYLSSKTAPESTVQSQGIINSFTGLFGKVVTDETTMLKIDGIVRETAHGVEYFILGALVFNALYICLNYRQQEEALLTAETGIECRDKNRVINCIICSVVVCTIYALSDEIHQIPIPGRAFQIMDLVIDIAGTIVGTIAMMVYVTIFSCTHQG